MFGKRIARALGLAAVMTMGFANAQTCSPTSPRLDAGTTFTPFNELERLEVRGGKPGTADWEWGVGKNTQTTGQFTSGNLDWVSGRTFDWTLVYGSNGSATLTVKSGTSTSLSLSYSSAPNGMRSGNALKFYAKTSADSGESKIYVVPTSINGKEVTGSLETQGTPTLSERSLFYYFPAMSSGFTAKGTVKFNFAGTTPPQGSRMNFTVTAGNITCGGTTTDTTAPTISGQAPNSLKLNTATPAISAQYADVGGIDTTKITLLVDGVNVTAQSTVSATGVTYTPTTALTNGTHTVQLNIADKANNPAQASWIFTVDTLLPTISGQTPNNIAVITAKPTISAQYADAGTGIDTTKTVLTVDGVNVTGQATATGISYVPTVALAAGTHNVTLKVFDQAGNSTQSAWTFSVDVAGPVISAQSPANAATISNTRPAISAQYADAGAGIDTTKTVLTVDGVNVTTQAAATATGITYTPTAALASGAHTVVLKVFDKAGNSSQSSWTFTVSAVVTDITPPTISAQVPNGLNLNSATPVISAQYADTGTGVDTTKVTLLVDGVNVTAQATISATGATYTPAAALTNGNHTVQLNIADKANNPAQASWSFTVDTQVPTISGQSPNNSSVNTATSAITAQYGDVGTGIDLTKTVLTVDSVNVTAQATATAMGISYTPTTALAAGAHSVSLKVFDQAGNSTQATWTFSVDIAGPVISAQTPANAATINNTQPTISAQYADQGAGIDTTKTALTVDGVNVTAQAAATASDISYTPTAPLTSGTHTVVLKVFDKAGNSSRASWSFSVDNGAPLITGQTPKDVSINNAKPTVSAQYADADAGVDATKTVLSIDGANVTAQAQVTATGINYTPTMALANGAHTVVLKVTDNAGNPAQTAWTFSIDTQGPAVTNLQPNNVIVGGATPPTISARFADAGAGIDLSTIVLLVDGVNVSAQSQVTATGVSYTPTAQLAGGQHTVQLSVSDLAGNSSQATATFTVDVSAPAITAQAPNNVTVGANPISVISAQFSDQGAGIDISKVTLMVDGVNVTGQAQITATGITFTAPTAYASGVHNVTLKVSDLAGNEATSAWSFTTDADGPTISGQSPIDVSLPADALPTITAKFADGGQAGVNTSSIKLMVDGVDVTSKATVANGQISYTPTQALVEGNHTIQLTVADVSGNATTKNWQFKTATAPSILNETPKEVFLPVEAMPQISAEFNDVGVGVDLSTVKLSVDEIDVTNQSVVSATKISYIVPSPLLDGTHSVKVMLADLSGNRNESTWRFATAKPPEVSSFAPRDTVLPASSTPTISAMFGDSRSGIDLQSVTLLVNDVDVTSSAIVSGEGISYRPTSPLPAGLVTVSLSVANRLNATSVTVWTFSIDSDRSYNVSFDLGNGRSLLNKANLLVKAVSNYSSAVSSLINGRAAVRQSESVATDGSFLSTWLLPLDLKPGSNPLAASVVFSDGTSRSVMSSIEYDAPPVVTITTPKDLVTVGALNPNSPRDLSGNVERPITIAGNLSKPVSSVTINQQRASTNGTNFSFDSFLLHEGTNLITVTAVDDFGRIGSASLTVYVDQTAPLLTVEAPVDGATTSYSKLDVRGVVNDAVEGGVNAPNPVVVVTNLSNGQAVTAKVGDRFYVGEDIPLEVGLNNLSISATDHVGNKRVREVRVSRVAVGSNRLTILSGNRQRAGINTELVKGLTIVAIDKDGNPLPNLDVAFEVLRGTGNISVSLGAQMANRLPARRLTANTDSAGRATVFLTLGKQSGEAGNMVRVSHPSMREDVIFTATGERGAPSLILIEGSGTQYAEVGSQPLEALSAIVYDSVRNPSPNIPVNFTIDEGDATLDGALKTLTVLTDKDGRAAIRPLLGGKAETIIVSAKTSSSPSNPSAGQDVVGAVFRVITLEQKEGPTQFTGRVYDHLSAPLAGVRLSIGKTNLSATTSADGSFTFESEVPSGKLDLFVDGRAVTNAKGQQYPSLHFEVTAVRGQRNMLPHPIYLPPLLMSESKVVGGTDDVKFTIPGFDGFEMIVKANSVTFPDGSRVGALVVSPVHLDKLPMVPPTGASTFMTPAWTIQPSGTRFDPPIEVRIPNSLQLSAGEVREIFQWDHDLATFVPMGRATVNEDASLLITDQGAGVTKAGWGAPPGPPLPNPDCGSNSTDCEHCKKYDSTPGICRCVFDSTQRDTEKVFQQVSIEKELEAPERLKKVMSFLGAESVKAKFKIVGQLGAFYTCCQKKGREIQNFALAGGGDLEGEGEARAGGPLGKVIEKFGGKAYVKLKIAGAVAIPEYKDDKCNDKETLRISGAGTLVVEGGGKWEVELGKGQLLVGGAVSLSISKNDAEGKIVRFCTGGSLFAKAEFEAKLAGVWSAKYTLINWTTTWPIDTTSSASCTDVAVDIGQN
jgi:Bacterial Ig-like domain